MKERIKELREILDNFSLGIDVEKKIDAILKLKTKEKSEELKTIIEKFNVSVKEWKTTLDPKFKKDLQKINLKLLALKKLMTAEIELDDPEDWDYYAEKYSGLTLDVAKEINSREIVKIPSIEIIT